MNGDAIDRLYAQLSAHTGERFLCLATTANVNNPPLLIGSTRFADGVIAGNLILRDPILLPAIACRFEDIVTMFLVDCEVKSGVDLAAAARGAIPSEKRHFFKPNDFTVEAADEWIAQRMPDLAGVRAAVIGAGNIGAKLALRLAERGCEVRLVGRRLDSLHAAVAGLNAQARGVGSIIAVSDAEKACADAAVIVGCTPGTSVIEVAAIEASDAALLLDVGNGCFTQAAIAAARREGMALEVLSPMAGWEGFVRRYLATRRLQQGLGRRQLADGIWIVSVGIMGAEGDVLVDDVSKPGRVIGVCNGMGDLLYGEEMAQRIKFVEERLGVA